MARSDLADAAYALYLSLRNEAYDGKADVEYEQLEAALAAAGYATTPTVPALPKLSEYVRVGDVLADTADENDRCKVTVLEANTWERRWLPDGCKGFGSRRDLDDGYRLILCAETVRVGDVLLWGDEHPVVDTNVQQVKLHDDNHGEEWFCWAIVDREAKMLRRAPIAEVPDAS